jgi:flagellar FliL protein
MADAPETEAKPAAAAKSGGSKLVPALIGLNSILVVAVLAVLFLRGGAGGAAAGGHGEAKGGESAGHGDAKGEKGDLPGPTTRLPDFVVHLRDADADRYARVSFEIEVGSEQDKERINGFMPRIRDAFIAYLSDRTLEELRGSENIARTKTALAERLEKLAPGVKVRALYVTDLVIQ